MRIRDLGELDGPVLAFGGPYSNLQALSAVIIARAAPAEHLICTGDIVAYGADPAACVAMIRSQGIATIAGNVERQLATGAGDCGCGFGEGTTCDRLSARWYAHADAAIGQDDRRWMATLPDMILFTRNGQRHAVIHGGVSDISRFLWPVSPDAEFAQEIALIEAAAGPVDIVISGHCGLAFTRHINGVLWLNGGAIGLPPNDGTPETAYARLDGLTPRIERLAYDHTAAGRAMERAGLTHGYDRALVTGFWPSEDILPPALRRAAAASSV